MIAARLRKRLAATVSSPPFLLEAELEIAPGVTGLYGPAGAGKTLLLELLAGLEKPDEGRILVDDDLVFDAAAKVDRPARVRGCAYLPAANSLFPHMTLRENLAFGAAGLPRLEKHRRVEQTLERFDLGRLAGRRPTDISQWDRLRCSLARMLLSAPRAVLMDAPAAGLSGSERRAFESLLREVRREYSAAYVLTTRDLRDCSGMCDQVAVISEGRILQTGPPLSVMQSPANLAVARLLGMHNLLEAEIVSLDPQRNSSRLRLGELELAGPYFRGKLRGDRVWLCIAPHELRLVPRSGRPGPNKAPAEIRRVTEAADVAHIELEGDLHVEMPRRDYEERKHNREWWVEFPSHTLRVM